MKLLILLFFIVPAIFCETTDVEELLEGEENNASKVVGGYTADIADFSYQVSVQLFHRGQYKHICGGSIVTPSHIVSAGHCYEDKTGSYGIRAGSNVTSRGGQFRTVSTVTVHPYFNPKIIDFDVAVLKLKFPLITNSLVQPIPLPSFGEDVDRKLPGTVSGWGMTSFNGRLAKTLQTVNVPIIGWGVCKTIYSELTNNMICAGDLRNGGVDSCQGDSGGPFVQRSLNGKQLTAVVSWGYQCASRGYPGVYARVSSFRLWIDSMLA